MIDDITSLTLGESDSTIEFDDSGTLRELSIRMASQCNRTLDIISRQLDRVVYDNEAFVDAVKQIALGSRFARIRILVNDVAHLNTQDHRLIELAARLSSFISVRVPAQQHKRFNEALLIADNTGYIHRRFADRFEGHANFNDKAQTAELIGRFNELWSHAELDPNLRNLHI